jgi:hypothetical protein
MWNSQIRFSERGAQHAGIVYIPNQMTKDERISIAGIAGEVIRAFCTGSRFAFRNCFAYPTHDGLRLLKGKDDVTFSWKELMPLLSTK